MGEVSIERAVPQVVVEELNRLARLDGACRVVADLQPLDGLGARDGHVSLPVGEAAAQVDRHKVERLALALVLRTYTT